MGAAREMSHRLRRETKRPDIEDLEAQAREEQRCEDYLAGLARERTGVEAELFRLMGMRPESRTWMPGDPVGRGEPPSAAERVRAAQARLDAVDAEIQRVRGE